MAAHRMLDNTFGVLVRLYPRAFRSEFEDEICAVFSESIETAADLGFIPLLQVCLREGFDLPGAIVRQYWRQWLQWIISKLLLGGTEDVDKRVPTRTRRIRMSEDAPSKNPLLSEPRLAILAALPFLLMSWGIAGSSLVSGGPFYTISLTRFMVSLAVLLVPVVAIAVVGLYALYKRMPDWGLTWVGSGYMGFLLFIKTASEELADFGRFITTQTGDVFLVLLILLAGLVLVSAAAIRDWQRAGLFSIGLASMLVLSLFLSVTSAPFNRHDIALLAAPTGLLLAALTYLYIRRPGPARIIMIVTIGLSNLVMTYAVNSVWQSWRPMQSKPSLLLPLIILVTAALLSGPVLGLFIQPIRRALRRA
jgi:hypothetical protein